MPLSIEVAAKAPTAKEKKDLQNLVDGIVLSQGNSFIKELLRERKIGIGTSKDEFQKALTDAINDGQLNKNHIEEWLHRVEGWGDQHVYLFHVPPATSQHHLWEKRENVVERLRRASLTKYWERETSQEFPSDMSLTGIYFSDRCLRITWHQGLRTWARDESKDYQEKMDDELYQFRAFRHRAERSVMRFEMRLNEKLAGVFVQESLEEKSHNMALKEVQEVASKLFEFGQLDRLNISRAVKGLDQAALTDEGKNENIRPSSTRLTSKGAYVEFTSTAGNRGYQDDQAVRRVRRAANPNDFRGEYGTFLFGRVGPRGSVRNLRVHLYGGAQHRVRLRAQMTATEVWEVLIAIKKYAQ